FIISNLFINRSSQSYIGFFGYLHISVLSNIRLQQVNMTGHICVGALSGCTTDDVQVINCNVSGTVRGFRCTGGLFGQAYSTNMASCYSLVQVFSESDFGGLIGYNESSNTINNSFYNFDTALINNQPKISRGALTNDLFNDWINNNLSLDINDYYTLDNSGRYLINDTDGFKHLLYFGKSDQNFILTSDLNLSSLSNLYLYEFKGIFDGNNHTISHFVINDTLAFYVGLFGKLKGSEIKNLALTDCSITGKHYIGGISASAENSSIKNCQVNLSINGMRDVGGIIGVSNSTQVENCSVSGSVTSLEYYGGGIIGKVEEFSTIFQCTNSAAVSGRLYIGGIVGFANMVSISYCTNSGHNTALDDDSSIGGIAGSVSGEISHCQNSGNLNGGSRLGGICGSSLANISFCTNTGFLNPLKLNVPYIGGIAGHHGGMKHISFCTNEGNIFYHSPVNVGGITGNNYSGYIRYCKNEGLIKGSSALESKIGGITGENYYYAIIKRSYNTGAVNDSIGYTGGNSYNFRRLGGICGGNKSYSIIEDCFNSGALSSIYNWGKSYFGAIAGCNSSYSFISNTYNIGFVTSNLDSTTFIYENDESAVKNSYWNSDISHIIPYLDNNTGNVVNVHGLTTAQMKDISTYTAAGWDFQNVWQIDPEINEGYP
ncbi:MAG TPA: ZmpA/ZmpB/ZmpC family metallo-endopeptidase-related protein, partial [Candidatus Cloacimonadota bacterium]|nr:ZmpA/ZmpB/ZmpC family metallo-endopeptidase-related protein [Candidatus Cloacimonadota bacterium]